METNTSLVYGIAGLVLIGLLFVYIRGGKMKKSSNKTPSIKDTVFSENIETIFNELIFERTSFRYYYDVSNSTLKNYARMITGGFNEKSRYFEYWVNEGAIKNISFDFYYSVWSEQLRGRIPLLETKRFVEEALSFLDYLIKADIDLEKGNNKALMDEGRYSELKHNIVRLYSITKDDVVKMIDSKNMMFFQEYAIWKRGMEATGLFVLEPSIDKMLVGINRIPREYFDFNTFEYIRCFLEQAVEDFFIKRVIPFNHMSVTNYQTTRIDRSIVIPRWYAEFGKPKVKSNSNTAQLER